MTTQIYDSSSFRISCILSGAAKYLKGKSKEVLKDEDFDHFYKEDQRHSNDNQEHENRS